MSDINNENMRHSVRTVIRLAECALFVVLMVVSAYIQIPFPLVPLSFQTVVAVLAGLLLGAGWGAAAIGVYIFMGLVGLPVFTGGGGFSYVLNLPSAPAYCRGRRLSRQLSFRHGVLFAYMEILHE